MNIPRTLNELNAFIADQVSECTGLEYKAADALARTDSKKRDITKDVSSFANSAGGIIIFGIKEHGDADKRHLPERLDPIDAREYSREWLDQIIGLIQPRIEGLEIVPVPVGPESSAFAYVVAVPQSDTAHQASDYRYYKRRNFESSPMEDYEVRDTMNRRKAPRLTVQVRVVAHSHPDRSHIALRITNSSRVLARHYAAVVRFPTKISRGLVVIEEGTLDRENGKAMWVFSTGNGIGPPLFPSSRMQLKQDIKMAYKIEPDPGESIDYIGITLYADEMEKIEETKELRRAEIDWV